VNVNGVTATGYANSLTNVVSLWLRNQTNDHGLGVCSEGATACSTGGGDVNELSNQLNAEAIVLERPDGFSWVELWVSSMDSGGTGGSEEGILYWGDALGVWNGSFGFAYPGINIEGDILALAAAAGFDENAKFVMFVNNSASGTNNDFLVWKGVLEGPQKLPEPGTLLLVGVGLAALGLRRRTT
jgi:hypothetical protein